MTVETVAHCRAFLDAGQPLPLYWQRVLLDDIERMQYALGEPAAHQTRYTVEPAHAPLRNWPGTRPSNELLDHWSLHSKVIHHHPGWCPDEIGGPQWGDDERPEYIRVVGLPGWPGWTFDIPADWDPDRPLPCPDTAIAYCAEERNGVLTLNEPAVPTGWTRTVHRAAADGTPLEVWHLPPSEPSHPGEPS